MFRRDNVSLVEFFEGGKSMFWPWRRHIVSCLVCSLGETEVTNHIGWWNTALRVKIKMLCCIVIHSGSAVKPNQFCFVAFSFKRPPGLDVMDACCHFHFNVFKIFATEFYVELSVVSI